jgi:glycosyltransferase involved in cell wall biosynthesis
MRRSSYIFVTVVNFSAPELNQLAVFLAERDELHWFVRPYVNLGRWWERLISRIPGLKNAYLKTFGRRRLPIPLGSRSVVEVGVASDLAASLVSRLPIGNLRQKERWTHTLQERLRRLVDKKAVRYVSGSSHVVGYPGFSRSAFLEAQKRGVIRVLNYPIAHHRHHLNFRTEEARINPAFAATWPPLEHFTPDYLRVLDEEIEMATVIMVGSAYAKRTFVEQGIDPDRIRVCPYGVDISAFQNLPCEKSDKFKVVFAGQIGQRKGLSYLLEGYRDFARHDTELHLIGRLVGSDAWRTDYGSLFQHTPHLTRSELARTLANCDVFVFPTLLEGMPLTVVEAMAAGLPIIATRNGPDEIVRDGVDGFLVPERDPAAISACLQRLYEDPELRRRMGQAAAERSRDFSWKRFADDFRATLVQTRRAD